MYVEPVTEWQKFKRWCRWYEGTILVVLLLVLVALVALITPSPASAQNYYRGYGGRTYYQPFWNQYMGRYSGYYARNYVYQRPSYAPRGGYDWSWGGGNRGYLGGRGGGWGGEW